MAKKEIINSIELKSGKLRKRTFKIESAKTSIISIEEKEERERERKREFKRNIKRIWNKLGYKDRIGMLEETLPLEDLKNAKSYAKMSWDKLDKDIQNKILYPKTTLFEDFLDYVDLDKPILKSDIETWLADYFDLPNREEPLSKEEEKWITKNLTEKNQKRILGYTLKLYKTRKFEKSSKTRKFEKSSKTRKFEKSSKKHMSNKTLFEDFLDYVDIDNPKLKKDIETWLADYFDLPNREDPLLKEEEKWIRENLSEKNQKRILGYDIISFNIKMKPPKSWKIESNHPLIELKSGRLRKQTLKIEVEDEPKQDNPSKEIFYKYIEATSIICEDKGNFFNCKINGQEYDSRFGNKIGEIKDHSFNKVEKILIKRVDILEMEIFARYIRIFFRISIQCILKKEGRVKSIECEDL